MKTLYLLTLALFASASIAETNPTLLFDETDPQDINKTVDGKKDGPWIIYGKDKPSKKKT